MIMYYIENTINHIQGVCKYWCKHLAEKYAPNQLKYIQKCKVKTKSVMFQEELHDCTKHI